MTDLVIVSEAGGTVVIQERSPEVVEIYGEGFAAVLAHVADADPHPGYVSTAELGSAMSAHEAAVNPHPGYVDTTELSTAITNHEGAADPHPVYSKLATLISSMGSSLIGFIQSGIGAALRTLQDKARDVVSVKDFYANGGTSGDLVDPTGQVDSTAGLQAALNSLAFGETLHIPGDCKILVTGDITVPKGCTLSGDSANKKGYADNRGAAIPHEPDFYDVGPAIHFAGTSKVILLAGAVIENLILIRAGMILPISYAEASAWVGTCVYSSSGNYSVIGCTIYGFNTGITSIGQRATIRDNNFDCWNGIDISNSADVMFISNNHMWPFLSAYWNTTATNDGRYLKWPDLRRNIGINLHDQVDWPELCNNFVFGYKTGYRLVGVHGVTLVNCGADNTPPASDPYVDSIGFLIDTSEKISLTNCRVAAQQIGIQNINSTGVNVTSLSAWANITHGILFSSGVMTVSNSSFHQGLVSSSGVTYADATGTGTLIIDDIYVTGFTETNIPINYYNNTDTSHFVIKKTHIESSSSPAIRTRPGGAIFTLEFIASAGTVVLPANGELFYITGNTNIGNFITEFWTGRRITLVFQALTAQAEPSTLTLVHSASLKLTGSVNAVMTPGSSISFVNYAATWTETARSIK